MSERVISADSHILLLDERVLSHLTARCHDDYESSRGAHHRPGATPSSLSRPERARRGVENLLWATDYPHADSTGPESQKVIEEQFARCTRDETRKMVSENAARLYRL